MRLNWGLSLACFPLLLVAAHAQYTANAIVFSNPGQYSQQDLEAAAGLRTGQSFSTADLSAAAQRLNDTGAFDEITATLDGPMKAVTVLLKVSPTPNAKLQRVSFDNLVWLTQEEITQAIHARVPLYRGYLPLVGNETDAATAALSAALASKGVSAKLTSVQVQPDSEHHDVVLEFSAIRPIVVVQSIGLLRVPTALAADVTKHAVSLQGSAYHEGVREDNTAHNVLLPLFDAGYLDAHLTGTERPFTTLDGQVQVSLHATVEAGAPYRVSSIHYAGGPLLAADAFAKAAALKPGDLASLKSLTDTLAPLRAAYASHGYLDAVIDPEPVRDPVRGPGTHTVAYEVLVTPGEVYHVKSVTPKGLSPAAQADFDRGWLLKPGDVYNAEYVPGFLKNNTALRALIGYSASFQVSADPETHLVDLTILFVSMPGTR